MSKIRRETQKPRRALFDAARLLFEKQTSHELMLGAALHERYGEMFVAQWVVSEFIMDFYCPILAIAIEVDGSSHRRSRTQARDEAQEGIVEAHGGVTLRFRNEEVVEDLPGVLERIHAAVVERVDYPVSNRIRERHGWRLPKKMRKALRAERDARGLVAGAHE